MMPCVNLMWPFKGETAFGVETGLTTFETKSEKCRKVCIIKCLERLGGKKSNKLVTSSSQTDLIVTRKLSGLLSIQLGSVTPSFIRQYFKEAQRKYTYIHQIPYHVL